MKTSTRTPRNLRASCFSGAQRMMSQTDPEGPAVPAVTAGCFAMDSPIFSRANFSCSIAALSALVTRGLRTVWPPREPGPPPRPRPLPDVSPRVVPPRPRPLPRLTVPSALSLISKMPYITTKQDLPLYGWLLFSHERTTVYEESVLGHKRLLLPGKLGIVDEVILLVVILLLSLSSFLSTILGG